MKPLNPIQAISSDLFYAVQKFLQPTVRPLSQGRLSRRRTAQRQAGDLTCPDDYEKSIALASDIISLSSLKMNARYNAGT